MSVSDAFRGVVDDSAELASDTNGFHLQPRCRICRNEQVPDEGQRSVGERASYAIVLRALGDDNATLEQRDRVTIDSIRNHMNRHFPVQQVACAPPIARSWSVGPTKTGSTSSRGWLPRSPRWPSLRPSW